MNELTQLVNELLVIREVFLAYIVEYGMDDLVPEHLEQEGGGHPVLLVGCLEFYQVFVFDPASVCICHFPEVVTDDNSNIVAEQLEPFRNSPHLHILYIGGS